MEQGSNPTDGTDKVPPPNGTARVDVTFGDHSGSHSEKYKVILEPLEGDSRLGARFRRNVAYGQVRTATFRLPKGSKYRVRLEHISTNPDYDDYPKPDYDYTLNFTSNGNDAAIAVIPEDPAGIFGVHDESDEFFAAGKSATLYVAWLTTETVAQFPDDDKRKKLGVGEEVFLGIRPASLPSPTWTLTGIPQTSALIPDANPKTAKLTVGTRACTPTVEAVILGTTLKIDYNVVQPSGQRAQSQDISYPAGEQGAGMQLVITTLPDDVSFYNIQIKEIDKGTNNIRGYFTNVDANILQHHPNPNWSTLDQQNRSTDTAFFHGFARTWAYGTYEWAIEVRWRVIVEAGQGEILSNITQVHTLHDITGNSTISKLNNSSNRSP